MFTSWLRGSANVHQYSPPLTSSNIYLPSYVLTYCTTAVFQNFIGYTIKYTLFIRTSSFGAEAERSYFIIIIFFLRFEPENVLSMFLKLCGIVFR